VPEFLEKAPEKALEKLLGNKRLKNCVESRRETKVW
jgi:hypothetical protein